MNRTLIWIIITVALVTLILLCVHTSMTGGGEHAIGQVTVANYSQERPNKKIFIVQSYHTGYPWSDSLTRGAKMALSNTDADIEVYYMDTKRRTSLDWKMQAGANAIELTDKWKPNIVITCDDNAQKYYASHYAGKDKPDIIFCGVNGETQDYGFDVDNVTGILERPHYIETINILKQLMPKVSKVFILCDDSPTSAGAIKYIKQQRYPGVEIVAYETPSTFEQWQQVVSDAQDKADAIGIYTYHTVRREGSDESISPKEVMQWTVENSNIPIIGFFTFTVDDGALCGFVESGAEQGFKAGQIAAEIINGKRISDIPVVIGKQGQSMINLNAAKRWSVNVQDGLLSGIDIVVGQ